ncbi:serine/threonine protein kinase [Micromonospora acroterricola]|uniref:non-specific serine/threonine protein kinase n=1 Tax=Micromonospora acroterricola TaxID=2202421 RepID=A0A317DEQ9_9ACTN|nr:serine/threonine-protein kinase [Micromonospora acroterricola]PWR11213.1 serine/threonine protein kinase [Micromonospora acroterricola]
MVIPSQVGRYRVVRAVGAGAFATVWLAYDDELRSPVAVKVLADNWSQRADIRARFRQEARFMRQVDSDHLVRVLDIGELPDGRPYLVMTYAGGGTLSDRLARGPMPVHEALRVAADIARAVAVLHDNGVLHRDLKPSNVLFDTTPTGARVLVADLGLAKTLAHASGFTVAAGTPAYMAPEQFVPGGGLDARSDVYAIGALTQHMLTGLPPGQPAGPVPRVPAAVERVVRRALHRDPGRRWTSANAYASALEELLAARRVPARRPLQRTRRSVTAVGALAAALFMGGSATVSSAPPGWTRVGDATGTISVAVPDSWARQLRDGGWNPATIGLPGGRGPGLLVGPNLAVWPDVDSTTPGVFAGVSRSLAGTAGEPALPAHNGCTREADRATTVGILRGSIGRWTRCGGTATSFSEVTLAAPGNSFGVYVQIKQIGGADRTDEILGTLRVDRSTAAQG